MRLPNWPAGISYSSLFVLSFISGSSVSGETPPLKVAEAMRVASNECSPGKVQPGPGFLKISDVNGDGLPDYVLDYESLNCIGGPNVHCGSGGCTHQIFIQLGRGSVVKAFDEQVQAVSFGRSGGRFTMKVAYHGSVCGRVGVETCTKDYQWVGAKLMPINQVNESSRSEFVGKSTAIGRPEAGKSPAIEQVVLVWNVNVDLQEGMLQASYGEPNTGNVIISFKCNIKTKTTKVYAGLRATGLKAGQKSDIVLSGNSSIRVPATAFLNEMTDQVELEGTFPSPADLRDYLVGSRSLRISVPGNSASADMGEAGTKALEFMATRC